MDMEILLALQAFRNGAGAFLAEFLSKMTFLGELNTALVLMAAVYWCVSREFGTYLLMGWSGNRLVNGLLKVSVCAYRPWIRDARIVLRPDVLHFLPLPPLHKAAGKAGHTITEECIKNSSRIIHDPAAV